ncbi:hypothetical protein M433DRAFT_538434 [Acidomyces richmondensis BFW]|nr:MAG: hypothetical protein FE78DRAFT_151344 [Acidomyces sp. 'richmondensis']KYG49710.1 hypothetical protein M433DRAFT_538434 [Acidomyces richmondensis BFW]
MGLEDFEKELAASKERSSTHHYRSCHNEGEDGNETGRHHRHHHRSHRHRDRSRDEERKHRHKRHREREDDGEERRYRRKRRRSESQNGRHGATDAKENKLQRDAWMQAPSALEIDYVQSRKPKRPPGQFVSAKDNYDFKTQDVGVNQHAADLQRDLEDDSGGEGISEQRSDIDYNFGDAGSSWRMTKLQAVFRQAEEEGRCVEDVALERYGDLREWDNAREEKRELDRRNMYGPDYVGVKKPSGELYRERVAQCGLQGKPDYQRGVGEAEEPQVSDMVLPGAAPSLDASAAVPLDATALNKLKAQMMRARLRGAPDAAQLEEEYTRAEAASLSNARTSGPDIVELGVMDSRRLAGDRSGEITAVSGKRGRQRGLVVENDDMSIADMVRQERRTRGLPGGEGRAFAERIARDGKFVDDLEYLDDNAAKLGRTGPKSASRLRETAIGEYQHTQRILDACPLCHDEERGSGTDSLPTAPVVSRATRTYLTLPTEPEIATGGAMIVPTQHRANLLECDDDEWEEIRNFMKSLTRHYAAQGRGVVFYENAAHARGKHHAALHAVSLPPHLVETAPAYFREAILASDEQWSQHRPLIDTLALSEQPGGGGRWAFRRAMAKEMPYFHVFFTLDGGLGHVVEDERRWPRGDLFAREVLGGMLGRGVETIRRQGRWEGRDGKRVEDFRKRWAKWDWTTVLIETDGDKVQGSR